jgi:hypothetical protein
LAARKDHRCDWRDRAEALQAELKVARDELNQLREKTGLLDEKIDAQPFSRANGWAPRDLPHSEC